MIFLTLAFKLTTFLCRYSFTYVDCISKGISCKNSSFNERFLSASCIAGYSTAGIAAFALELQMRAFCLWCWILSTCFLMYKSMNFGRTSLTQLLVLQTVKRWWWLWLMLLLLLLLLISIFIWSRPVSYTHLDVYKRQT